MDFNKFHQYFQSSFNHSLKNVQDVWADFVSKSSEDVLREAVDNLEEIYTTKKQGSYKVDPPTLPEVKREYFRLFYRGQQATRFCDPGCDECHGTGTVWGVLEVATQRPLNPRTPEPLEYSSMGLYAIACPNAYKALKRDFKGFGACGHDTDWRARGFMAVCDNIYRRDNNKPILQHNILNMQEMEKIGEEMLSTGMLESILSVKNSEARND